jgi:hypothetical protein
VKRWTEQIAERPAAQKGVVIPTPIKVDTSVTKDKFIEEAQKMLIK